MIYLYALIAAAVVMVAIFLAPLRHKVWLATGVIAAAALTATTFHEILLRWIAPSATFSPSRLQCQSPMNAVTK